jgi:SAM-dependent methyltransferase
MGQRSPSPRASPRASPVPDPSPSPRATPGPSSGAIPVPVYFDDEFDLEQPHTKEKSHPDAPRRLSIEPADADEPVEEDEFAITDGYDTRSHASTSATSTIYAHTFENGRRYQHFKHGRYPIPNDENELSREDMKHAMLMELTDGRLFYAPIDPSPQSILDIGTGTGIWAIEVGDQYPSARVRGVDLSPVQPLWVPPNVDFLVDDCEKDEWLARDVDLVHLRFMTVVLKDVHTVLRRAHESLKPGGWIELQELSGAPLCDDGTMPPDDPVKYLYDKAAEAFAKFGMNVTLPKDLGPMLEAAGFDNIHCIVKKVPIGVWARDKTLRLIGLYQKEAVREILPVIGGRPFAALGMSRAEIDVTVAMARKGLDDTNVHRYFHYYFWFAQKPLH